MFPNEYPEAQEQHPKRESSTELNVAPITRPNIVQKEVSEPSSDSSVGSDSDENGDEKDDGKNDWLLGEYVKVNRTKN